MLQLETEVSAGQTDMHFKFDFPNRLDRKPSYLRCDSLRVSNKPLVGNLTMSLATSETALLKQTQSKIGSSFLKKSAHIIATITKQNLSAMTGSSRQQMLKVKVSGGGDPILSVFNLALPKGTVFASSSKIHLRLLGYSEIQIFEAAPGVFPAPATALTLDDTNTSGFWYVENPNTEAWPIEYMPSEPMNQSVRGDEVNYYLREYQRNPMISVKLEDTTQEDYDRNQAAIRSNLVRLEDKFLDEIEEPVTFGLFTPKNLNFNPSTLPVSFSRDSDLSDMALVLNETLTAFFRDCNYVNKFLEWTAHESYLTLTRYGEVSKTQLTVAFDSELRSAFGVYEPVIIRANGLIGDQPIKTGKMSRVDTKVGHEHDYPVTIGCAAAAGTTYHEGAGIMRSAGVITRVGTQDGQLRIASPQPLKFESFGSQHFTLSFVSIKGKKIPFGSAMDVKGTFTIFK